MGIVSLKSSGPVLVMVLEKSNAVSDWRGLIGPTDARKAKISHPHRFDLFPDTSFVFGLFIDVVSFEVVIF